MSVTGGLDIGLRSIKMAILSHRGAETAVVAKAVVQISGCLGARAARTAIRESWRRVLTEASLSARDVDIVASTGSGALRQVARVGHLYGHSSNALGAQLLFPDATGALEVDANQIHCSLLSGPRGGIRRATWNGERRGSLASAPFPQCLATRAAILLRSLAAGRKVVLTGGMVLDTGFVQSLWSRLVTLEADVSLLLSADAIFAGAFGAAILANRRFARISRSLVPVLPGPSDGTLPGRSDRSLN